MNEPSTPSAPSPSYEDEICPEIEVWDAPHVFQVITIRDFLAMQWKVPSHLCYEGEECFCHFDVPALLDLNGLRWEYDAMLDRYIVTSEPE